MSNMYRAILPHLLAGTALISGAAQAQDEDAVEGILACRAISGVEARLACFDAAADRLAGERDSGELVVVERADIDAVERESFGFDLPSLPRFRLPQFNQGSGTHDAMEGVDADAAIAVAEARAADNAASAGEGDAAPAAPAEPVSDVPEADEIRIVTRNDDGAVDTVRMRIESTRIVGYDTTVFYMENGQVWRQIDDGRVRMPRNDDEVYAEIRRGAMTSYLLRINGRGRAIRVERRR